MEYNSFYGGRQGAPFIISGSFNTIAEMQAAFKQGDNYRTINYDEYVIIDSINKNDKDNGKVFQRGRDYQKTETVIIDGQEVIIETGDAQYIGQIVGPAGPTPHTYMTTIDVVEDKAEEESHATDGRTYHLSEGNYAPTVNLVPGAKGTVNNRTFDTDTDSIQYAMVSVRDANGHDAEIYVGFKFPYTIIDFYTTSAKPYQNGRYADVSNIEQVEPKNHPYYEKWHITVPEGIPGDALKNFRVITADDNDGVEAYADQTDDRANDRKILVYDYYDYNDYENGNKKTLYLGSYNMIDSISEQDGVITIHYSHDDDQTLATIKYITDVQITTSTGKMVVTYNTKNNNVYESDTWNLAYVVGASLAETGEFSIQIANGTSTPTSEYKNTFTWVKDARVQSTGEFEIKKNNINSNWEQLATIKYVHSIEMTNSGDLNIYYNTAPTTPENLGNIKFIKEIKGTSGYIQVDYNNGTPSTFIWQGTTNSTGAIIAEESPNPSSNPEPVFAEGSPWFIVEEYTPFNRELSYIESTGEQYIDLEMTVHPKTKVELSFELTELDDGGQKIFGAGGWKPSFTLQHMISGYNYVFCSKLLEGSDAIGPHRFSQSAVANTLYNVELISDLNSQSAKINGIIRYTGSTVLPSTQISNSLYIFNVNEAITAGNNAKMKLYNCKIYIDDILVKDLIPVLDKNNIPCLYDSVSDKFFYNKGTGQFLYE